ncbi:protein kinase-like protein activator [Phyllosticta citribraziliensis]|uniref:Protein kinase-like protein activator n=1 Tax=Phyllosticta citribraziliensis TaxID=989973 RepID=A0ABR1LKY7_9PEZI
MASFFSSVRQGFGGRKGNSNQQQPPPPKGNNSPTTSYQSSPQQSYQSSSATLAAQSPSMSASTAGDAHHDASQQSGTRKPPYFFRDEYANLIVKGNFMTLAARPKMVDEGEWLAHQVVEQYRLLDGMISIIKTLDERTGRPICNPESCPTMSAAGHTYTWLDNNKKPIKIPAYQYIQLVQKWIVGKISDQNLFPTDTTVLNQPAGGTASSYASGGLNTPGANTPIPAPPTSINAPLAQLSGKEWVGKPVGFPEHFLNDIKSIYRQMMRCYAHLYHGHWLDPFWHLNAYKELNTCFIHFVNVGKQFDLISDKEMEPMMPLIQLWLAKGLLPEKQLEQPPQQAAAPQAPVQESQVPPGMAQ